MLTLYRAHTRLLEFTPSARGTPAAAAARLATLLATVAAEQRTDVHFTMMAGDVHVVDGPPAAPAPKFDYAAMRAKAVADAAAAKAAEAGKEEEEEECDAGEDDEECGVKW
jgi:nucleotide-binding universal stress UspA family protein